MKKKQLSDNAVWLIVGILFGILLTAIGVGLINDYKFHRDCNGTVVKAGWNDARYCVDPTVWAQIKAGK